MVSFLVAAALTVFIVAHTSASPVTPNVPQLFARTSCGTGSESCVASTAASCCFESPNGLFAAPQFWDTSPATGPSNSWTIHGLWPDKCDSTYEESCDASREYSNPTALLQAAGRTDLISYMTTFWLNNSGASTAAPDLWSHEWNHHGTCMNTLETSCMPSGSATGTDAVYYFDRTVSLFKTLPTYTWLSAAGITPSATTTHTLASLQAAIKASWGFTPAFDCSSSAVYQVYYYFHLKGSAIDGTWVPINAPVAGSCPSSGIKYLVKSGSAVTSGTGTPTTTASPPSGTALPSKSTITALRSSGTITGGLLSLGTWSVQTLATYTAAASGSGYTLTTSKGSCGVSSGTFSCGSGLSSIFTGTVSGSNLLLTYGGSTQFSANSVPSGTTQVTVLTGSAGSQLIQFIVNAS